MKMKGCLVLFEEGCKVVSGDLFFFPNLSHALSGFYSTEPCMFYKVVLTRRGWLRLVQVDRQELIEATRAAGMDMKKLAHVRNPFKGKPGLPEGSQHITTDEAGELVIRPYQEAP